MALRLGRPVFETWTSAQICVEVPYNWQECQEAGVGRANQIIFRQIARFSAGLNW